MSMTKKIGAVVQDFVAYRRTLAELDMLSDRDCADLGIRREDFRAIAKTAMQARGQNVPFQPKAGIESHDWSMQIGSALGYRQA